MKVLSFDVGIKNLSYCLINSKNNIILDWGILNISIQPTCQHINTKGICCDKSATKFIKESNLQLCTSHSKLKQYKELKLVNCKKSKDHLLEIGIKIVDILNEKPDFLNVDIVCIENQPALKNPIMKTIQMIIYSYFLTKGVCEKKIKNIILANASNKLKVYKGPLIKLDIKDRYKRNKMLSIQHCDYMIHKNQMIDKKFLNLFKNSKKKDDLADSYLQGMYYILN